VADGPDTKDLGLNILVFDSSGNQLTANTDVLKNESTATITPNTGVYGGNYGLSSQFDGTKRSAVLTFSSNVATAFIGWTGDTLRSFRVFALNGTSTAFSKSTRIAKGARFATAAPATGHYVQGTKVINASVAAGGSPGWVCTTTGQSGTLVGITAATTNGSKVVTFSDATDLAVGYAVTIAGVTGTKIIEALEGAVALVDSNCDATVGSGAVAHVAMVFRTEAVVA
jgi:hypothetical protein